MSSPSSLPLVSVVVPAFNVQETLSETVRSATAGTYRNIEIILVDDGASTDATSAVAEELADEDHRVRIACRGQARGCVRLQRKQWPLGR